MLFISKELIQKVAQYSPYKTFKVIYKTNDSFICQGQSCTWHEILSSLQGMLFISKALIQKVAQYSPFSILSRDKQMKQPTFSWQAVETLFFESMWKIGYGLHQTSKESKLDQLVSSFIQDSSPAPKWVLMRN